MNKEEVVLLIENLESAYVASTIGLVFISNPDIRKIGQEWLGGSDVPVGFARKKENSGKEYTLSKIFNDFFDTKVNVNAYLNLPVIAMIPEIYDLLKRNDLLKADVHEPEYEFFFHIRNAMSHGNRFNFTNKHRNKGEIKIRYPASFKNFVIEKNMHGMPNVIPDYVEIADILDLIEYIKNDIKQS